LRNCIRRFLSLAAQGNVKRFEGANFTAGAASLSAGAARTESV